MINFWEIVDRAENTGKMVSAKDFDMSIFEKTSELIKKYDIKYDKNSIISSDDSLIDRIFEAGKELYEFTGSYYTTTGRVIKFSKKEIEEELKLLGKTPSYIYIGQNNEKKKMEKRGAEDSKLPVIIGGFVEDSPEEGEMYEKIYQSVAQEKIVDGIYYGPPPDSIEGREYTTDSPLEGHAARCSVNWVREATRRAGRPGLHLLDANASALGSISAFCTTNGLTPADAIAVALPSELRVDQAALNKIGFALSQGCFCNPYWTTMIGGYAGGPEGAAVVSTASAISAIMLTQITGSSLSGYVLPSNIESTKPANTNAKNLWCRNIVLQALARNTNLITGGGGLTSAGPGTEEMLWETAALSVVITAGGGHRVHGVRKAVISKSNFATGLESRFLGEVAHAAAGMTREETNNVILKILSHYEDKYQNNEVPEGYAFPELYNLDRVEPKDKYLKIYNKVKNDLVKIGLNF